MFVEHYAIICLSILVLTLIGLYISAISRVHMWRTLENNGVKYCRALENQLQEVKEEQELNEKFRTRPGMATVPDEYVKKYLDLELSNKRLTAECDRLHLEAAKYMDMYRNEKFKPKRKGS
jgi:hypothetical protein